MPRRVSGHRRLLLARFAASRAWWAASVLACLAAGGQRWISCMTRPGEGVKTRELRVAHLGEGLVYSENLRETRKEQAERKRDGSLECGRTTCEMPPVPGRIVA